MSDTCGFYTCYATNHSSAHVHITAGCLKIWVMDDLLNDNGKVLSDRNHMNFFIIFESYELFYESIFGSESYESYDSRY